MSTNEREVSFSEGGIINFPKDKYEECISQIKSEDVVGSLDGEMIGSLYQGALCCEAILYFDDKNDKYYIGGNFYVIDPEGDYGELNGINTEFCDGFGVDIENTYEKTLNSFINAYEHCINDESYNKCRGVDNYLTNAAENRSLTWEGQLHLQTTTEYVLVSQGVVIGRYDNKYEAEAIMKRENEDNYKYQQEAIDKGEDYADNEIFMYEERIVASMEQKQFEFKAGYHEWNLYDGDNLIYSTNIDEYMESVLEDEEVSVEDIKAASEDIVDCMISELEDKSLGDDQTHESHLDIIKSNKEEIVWAIRDALCNHYDIHGIDYNSFTDYSVESTVLRFLGCYYENEMVSVAKDDVLFTTIVNELVDAHNKYDKDNMEYPDFGNSDDFRIRLDHKIKAGGTKELPDVLCDVIYEVSCDFVNGRYAHPPLEIKGHPVKLEVNLDYDGPHPSIEYKGQSCYYEKDGDASKLIEQAIKEKDEISR